MSTFVLKREYALELPTSYVEIDNDEMEYVDGGFSMPRGVIAGIIDAGALIVAPWLAPLKYAGKAAAIAYVKVNLQHFANAAKKIIQWAIGTTVNMSVGAIGNLLFSNAWCFTSIGGIVSLIADAYWSGIDGKIAW